MLIWIGIDDTDSRKGMCTTYIASLIIREIEKNHKVIGFPRLIRLNPNIPFKTRGNGAVSFLVDTEDLADVIDIVNEHVIEYAELESDPGVVFINPENQKLMNSLHKLSVKALKDVVKLDEAFFIIGKFFIPHLKFKKGRGLIGALSAVGMNLDDMTLELLTYRKRDRFGKKREINKDSFFQADLLCYPDVWDTVDWYNDTVVCVPNSPDPVLFGLRGDKLEKIILALKTVECEDYDFYQIFVTNQATDMHIIDEDEVESLDNFKSYSLTGKVIEKPYEIEGGHVFFKIDTRFGEITCSAFEPTKQFRNVIRALFVGDFVKVYGAMKNSTLNIEKINLIRRARVFIEENPICWKCKKRMESAGRGKGFRCRECKTTANYKILREIKREIEEGFYEVPPVARRHLSKPLVRMNVRNKHIFR